MITMSTIDVFFRKLCALPECNVMSPAGFSALAEWCERQEFWGKFAAEHRLGAEWRAGNLGDPNAFALAMYRFQMRLRDGE